MHRENKRRLMSDEARLLILYGSETGNAEDVAERIGREARRQLVKAIVLPMDAYDPSKLSKEDVAVFVASTTGQGDTPDNMKSFWRFLLRRNLQPNWLKGLKYAVFGLGDSGYIQYNVVVKKLDRRLSDLGGKAIVSRGLGDDQHPSGYEAALDPWLASLWMELKMMFALQSDSTDVTHDSAVLDDPKYRITYYGLSSTENRDIHARYKMHAETRHMLDSVDVLAETLKCNGPSTFSQKNPFLACMLSNVCLSLDANEKDVRHIEFDLGNSEITYKPGDVLAIIPSQDDRSVAAFMTRCNLNPDTLILVEPFSLHKESEGTVTRNMKPTTIRTLIESMMDIASASPRRYFFEVMSHFATVDHEKERLIYFASPEGRDDLYQYNQRERRTVLEVLEDFPSVQLPLEWLLQLVPRLQPRLFSISSSMLAHPRQVHITVAVKRWLTPYKRTRHGLCSTWLSQLDPSRDSVYVPVWIQQGSLKLPDPYVPLILVGPGTGCAPFHAFIEELAATQKVSPVLFFFGCRSESLDFLYREFWLTQAGDLGVISKSRGGGFFVAFSRDQPTKVYVQDKIREQSKKVWKILQDGGAVYVAGSANKMPTDVSLAFEDVIALEGGLSKDRAQQWLKQLQRAGKYHIEAW